MLLIALPLLLAYAIFLALPGAWLIMLALGNFGFPQFGLIDCLPAGAIIGLIGGASSSSSSN